MFREHAFPEFPSPQPLRFPSTYEAVKSSHGRCSFDPYVAAPTSRGPSSIRHQMGNTMHVNMMGVFELAALLCMPTLGMASGAGSSSTSKCPPPSSSAMAMATPGAGSVVVASSTFATAFKRLQAAKRARLTE